MTATPTRPAPYLTAMLEGSFSCLIFLGTVALITPGERARSLALIAFAAISVAVTLMLALPSSWIRRKPPVAASRDPAVATSSWEDDANPNTLTPHTSAQGETA